MSSSETACGVCKPHRYPAQGLSKAGSGSVARNVCKGLMSACCFLKNALRALRVILGPGPVVWPWSAIRDGSLD